MRLLFIFLALTACDSAAEPGPTAPAGTTPPDLGSIPAELRNAPIPATHGGVDLHYGEATADAVTAYADCSALVLACMEEGGADFGVCVDGTPTCASATPWTEASCCPKACKDAFHAKGGDPYDAFMNVFVEAPTCFPGLEGA